MRADEMKGGKKGVQREAWKVEGAAKPNRGRGGARKSGRVMEGETEREQGAHVTWEVAVTLVRCN
jgi:hypothetical protein